MNLKIGQILTATEFQGCELIATFGAYQIYLLERDISFLFAVDRNNLICSCFEFTNTEDGMQLAHMNTLPNLQGQGIGSQILKEAISLWTVFELPSIDTDQTYYFIEMGLPWIRHCFDNGILKQPPFKRP